MQAAILDDRGVVDVRGAEAGEFLQRLVTNDVLRLQPSEARYAALLSPQGKVIVDFLVVSRGGAAEADYLLDCPLALAPELAKRLTMYRLRAKVTIADRSAEIGIAAIRPERPAVEGLVYRDPRSDALGFRVAAAHASLAAAIWSALAYDYRAARIGEGIPEGGFDFTYGETFPHEANLDRLHGVDFSKGCYVGQEVVSRVQHRGTARKRILRVVFDGAVPARGAPITAGDSEIGTMGSAIDGQGLAMIRTDRAEDALAAGSTITCAGIPIRILMA